MALEFVLNGAGGGGVAADEAVGAGCNEAGAVMGEEEVADGLSVAFGREGFGTGGAPGA